MVAYNRMALTRCALNGIIDRARSPFSIIAINNGSDDGTEFLLSEYEKAGYIRKTINLKKEEAVNLSEAYNLGFQEVQSKYFVTMMNDILVPDLDPDWLCRLTTLIHTHQEYGGIGCRIQHMPNCDWSGESEVVDARKGLSAYARIQRKEDIESAGGFGDRIWEELGFMKQMMKIGKKCGWARHIWCNHMGNTEENRGYSPHDKDMLGYHHRDANATRKPYPRVHPKTNVPFEGEKLYR